eukprot:3717131-Rhodomonas_salina.2
MSGTERVYDATRQLADLERETILRLQHQVRPLTETVQREVRVIDSLYANESLVPFPRARNSSLNVLLSYALARRCRALLPNQSASSRY